MQPILKVRPIFEEIIALFGALIIRYALGGPKEGTASNGTLESRVVNCSEGSDKSKAQQSTRNKEV